MDRTADMDSGFLKSLVQVGALIWRSHFKVPKAAYWAAFVFSTGAILPSAAYLQSQTLLLAGLGVLTGSALGIARWSFYRRGPVVVALPLFRTARSHADAADEIQRMIVTAFQDHLGERAKWIHALPVVVGPESPQFAIRLRERLNARYLVYGEVRVLPDGGRSVYARILEPLGRFIEHHDWHTRDITTLKTVRDYVYYKLAPEKNVSDIEYPFGFTNEIESLVRAIEGEFYSAIGAHSEAVAAFRSALEDVPDVESEAVDGLRVNLAWALFRSGAEVEAIQLLEERAASDSASADILQSLADLIWLGSPEELDYESQLHRIDLLRRAARDRDHPRHDQTLYNLGMQLVNIDEFREEALSIFRRLAVDRSSHYSRAWYLMREIGVYHYREATEGQQRDVVSATKEGKLASCWYGRALRARPKVRIVRHRRARFHVMRIPGSPILLANLVDAHEVARHRLRVRWYTVREHRLKRKFRRVCARALTKKDFVRAYAYAEWCLVGRATPEECFSAVIAAYAAALAQRADWFARCWNRAAELNVEVAQFMWDELMAMHNPEELPELQPPPRRTDTSL